MIIERCGSAAWYKGIERTSGCASKLSAVSKRKTSPGDAFLLQHHSGLPLFYTSASWLPGYDRMCMCKVMQAGFMSTTTEVKTV